MVVDLWLLVVLIRSSPPRDRTGAGCFNVMTWGCWALSFYYDTELGEIALDTPQG